MTPPRLTRLLMAWLTPADLRTPLVDDLDEAFARRVSTAGRFRARWWYRRQVVAGLWALLTLHYRRRSRVRAVLIGEEVEHMNRMSLIDVLWQDLRHALRALRSSPGFTAVAVLSLALGIGANTAVFSVVHAVLLRPLPYPQPDRLVLVTPPDAPGSVNLPQYAFWKQHASVLSLVAGRNGASDVSFSAGGDPEWIKVMPITADFFRTLGVVPALGREFVPDELRTGGPRAIILTDALWRRLFHADPQVIHRVATIGETSYAVVGVLPRDFWLPEPADAFYPLRPTGRATDKGLNTEMIARLAPGVSSRQVDVEMAALNAGFVREFPDAVADGFRGLTTMSYQRSLVGDVRTNLLLLFGAVGVLLLIACSNLASLLLARFAAREREIAVRLALGASTARLLRQFTVENALLCLTGSAAGVMAAYWVLDGFVALVPFHLPVSAPIRLDLAALGFAVAAGLSTGFVFSLAPLVASTRRNTHDTLRAAGRSHGGTRRGQRARSVLVVAEIALSVSLLMGAALLIQSLYRMHQEPLGFLPDGVLTFWTPPQAASRQDGAARWNFESAMVDRLRPIPGVTGVAGVNVLPLTSQSNFPAERVGHPDEAIGGMEVRTVTPGYFDVMGIPVKSGRAFTRQDTAAAPPVILVNETLARRWWPGVSPLGDQIAYGRYKGKPIGGGTGEPPREVVGVVADTKTVYLKAPPRPTIYIPSAQAPWMTGGTAWVVRGDLPSGLAERVRQTIAAADPRQRVQRVQTLRQIVAITSADSRFNAWLCGVFACLALILTAIGIYGLLAFSVARRTSELGTRIALGASQTHVMMLVLRQGLGLTAMGLTLGLTGALLLGRFVAALLFGVGPTDVASVLVVSILLLCVGLLASSLPAWRAAKVDPLVALRSE